MFRLFGSKEEAGTQGSATVAEVAGRHFAAGRNCCESVLLAHLGEVDPQIIAIAKAFGGGVGGSKCICGAVSGAVMVLGCKGRQQDAGRLIERFKAANQATCCKVLSAPYKWKSREHLANCRRLTMEAAAEVEKLLNE